MEYLILQRSRRFIAFATAARKMQCAEPCSSPVRENIRPAARMKMPVLFKTLLSRSGTVGADQLVAVVDLEPSRGREAVGEIGFQVGPGVADDRFGSGRVQVVRDRRHFDVPVAAGFEAQQCVVDAAQPGRGDQNDRQAVLGDVIDRQVCFRQRNVQPAGAFDQYRVVFLQQLFRAPADQRQVDVASVDRRCQMRRGRIGEHDRAGRAVLVLREQADTHDPAVGFDILRQAVAARLDEFLRDHAFSARTQGSGQHACDDALTCVRVDPCDEIGSFHISRRTLFDPKIVPLPIGCKYTRTWIGSTGSKAIWRTA